MDETKRYTVGQMAELCSVSAKQLRYYDNNGILAPAWRDERSGYRYYTEEQIEEVLLIRELNALGVSLKNIGGVIGSRDLSSLKAELESTLVRAREELEAARRKYDRTVEVLLRVLRSAETAHSARVELTHVPETTVVFTRYVSYWNAKKLFISRRAELYQLANAHGLHMTGANMAVFHSGYLKQFSDAPEDGEGDLEICIRVTGPRGNLPCCRTIPAFAAVTTLHTGHYRTMKPAYLRMEAWAREHGYALSGVSIEEYLVGASMTKNKDDYVTRLYLPVEGSGV